MGFALSVIYFVTYYLTPAAVFGPLAALHIQIIIAALLIIVSVPTLLKSFTLKMPQSLALLGLAIAVFLSVLIGMRWPGGAVQAFLNFVPNAFAFFIVCIHCNTIKKLKVLAAAMLFVCLFVIAHGAFDLLRGLPESPNTQEDASESSLKTASPYFLRQLSDNNVWIYRLEGLGEINDPNDFAQVIVSVIPFMFLFWRPRNLLWNILVVLLPLCAFLFGAYLTHSRGSLVALMAVIVVAARRRIGTVPSLVLAAGIFIAASALQFTGGRDISASAGSGRTGLWGESMQVLVTHPLFGVGYGNLVNYTDDNLTAHNSVVVCAAELGLFGLYFWSLFLYSTISDALAIASPANVTEAEPIVPEDAPFPQTAFKIEEVDKAEINRVGSLMVLSLTGYLVTGLFLSRAFILTPFLLGGMAEAAFLIALKRGMVPPRMPLARLLKFTGGLTISLVVMMYILIRALNLMH
jgi:O-antigen ligase